MKLHQLFLTFLLLLAAFQFCFSQEKPKAVLIDNIIYPANCDDLVARLQRLMDETTNKNSVSYVIIHPVKGKLLPSLLFERWTIGRKFPSEKFIIVRGKEENELRLELWLVPKGAELSFAVDESTWNFSLPSLKKPYQFYSYTNGEDAICNSEGQKKHFAEILLANPTFRGHLVIYEKTLEKYRRTKNLLVSELVKDYSIPHNQLRTFFVKEIDYDFSNVEFWLVPQRKK